MRHMKHSEETQFVFVVVLLVYSLYSAGRRDPVEPLECRGIASLSQGTEDTSGAASGSARSLRCLRHAEQLTRARASRSLFQGMIRLPSSTNEIFRDCLSRPRATRHPQVAREFATPRRTGALRRTSISKSKWDAESRSSISRKTKLTLSQRLAIARKPSFSLGTRLSFASSSRRLLVSLQPTRNDFVPGFLSVQKRPRKKRGLKVTWSTLTKQAEFPVSGLRRNLQLALTRARACTASRHDPCEPLRRGNV